MAMKRKHIDEDPDATAEIFRSEPLEDRQSAFVGLFSPSLKPKELQKLAEIESASHKILGWRRQSNQQSITKATQYVTGSDDDGEKYAGRKVERVLESSNVVGSCVVARWYGGVLLGPVRFAHIENVAKEAIRKWQDDQTERQARKRRREEDDAERTRLSQTLVERDQSIAVLRALAAEKEKKLKDAQTRGQTEEKEKSSTTPGEASNPGVKAAVDYTSMELDRLVALERGRDATLSFLLKRIDKAEAELARLQDANAVDPP
ncbi:ribosomal S5 domain 2 [Lecanosticta acicola]|uniref:Ribosomal S5 domain 2 n=1 Tax=Lecanosticta acicola TaxID=111012 RepID=A0AAI8YUP8_9PEZI|nr:ribosomal S5 domain 2 [Lecanosticta acicola]